MFETIRSMATASVLLLALAATAPAPAAIPPEPAATHEQLAARIAAAGDLSEPQRARMELNLEACRALGLPPGEIAPLFPDAAGGGPTPDAALRLQDEVIRAARADLPVDPLLAKVREGRLKGVADAVLVRATGQVAADLGAAADLLTAARADGLAPPADAAARHEQVRVLSRAMWRGLTPAEGEALRARARERLEHGPCATADLAAAAETAVRLREQGADRDEAVRLAGAALARGYTAPDLAELGRLVTAGRLGGGDLDALLADLTDRVDGGLAAGALNRYLQQSGWMGPADAPGAGGRQPGGHQGDDPGNGGPGGPGGDAGGTGGGTDGQQGDGRG